MKKTKGTKGNAFPLPASDQEEIETGRSNAKRLADMAGAGGGTSFEGEQVKIGEIEGEEVIVLDFNALLSTFKPGEKYVCLQIKRKGKLCWMNVNAQVIVRAFTDGSITKESLPSPVIFRKVTGKSNRQYWAME